jgi:uncharacterized phiE125 gp8 family phage protein
MKEFLRVDHTDEDTTITALLDAAVSHVSDYCNRHFTASDTAIFYLERWRSAALAFGPVTGITSVVYDDTTGTQQTLDASKYYWSQFREGSWRIYFHDVPDLEDYNAQPVRINVNVGRSASSNVEHAVRMLVAHWYENRRAVVTGTITAEIPMAVQAILNSERIIDLNQ